MLQLLKNKHMILAMFVAPILAIVAYFGTGMLVSKPPQTIQQGQTYPLVSKSNCRYESGVCTLKNADIEIHFRAQQLESGKLLLKAESNLPLDGVHVSISSQAIDSPPNNMETTKDNKLQWQAVVPINVKNTTSNLTTQAEKAEPQSQDPSIVMRVALQAHGATFFAETSTAFFNYQTSFSQQNMSKI